MKKMFGVTAIMIVFAALCANFWAPGNGDGKTIAETNTAIIRREVTAAPGVKRDIPAAYSETETAISCMTDDTATEPVEISAEKEEAIPTEAGNQAVPETSVTDGKALSRRRPADAGLDTGTGVADAGGGARLVRVAIRPRQAAPL